MTSDIGRPRIRITVDLRENEWLVGEYIRAKMEKILKELGVTKT
jgi:hypothetical protein